MNRLLPLFVALPLCAATSSNSFGSLVSSNLGPGLSGSLYIVDDQTIQLRNFRPQQKTRIRALDARTPVDYASMYLRESLPEEYLRPVAPRRKLIPRLRRPLNLVLRFHQFFNSLGGVEFVGEDGSVLSSIPIGGLIVPSSEWIKVADGLSSATGIPYNVSASAVYLVDRRTLAFENFVFDGTKPPDGWIYGGTEVGGPSKDRDAGVRLMVQSLDVDASADEERKHCAMTTLVSSPSLKATLPAGLSVCDLAYVGVYCYQYAEDFGHTRLSIPHDCGLRLPPYLPPVRRRPLRRSLNCP